MSAMRGRFEALFGGYSLFLTPPSLGGDPPQALRPARNPPCHRRWRTACAAGRCTTNAANDAAAGAACTGVPTRSPPGQPSTATGGGASGRSEERRVGKECRGRGAPCHEVKEKIARGSVRSDEW